MSVLLNVLAEAVAEGDVLADPFNPAYRWRVAERRVLRNPFPNWAGALPLDVCAWLVEPVARDAVLQVWVRANDEVVTVEVDVPAAVVPIRSEAP